MLPALILALGQAEVSQGAPAAEEIPLVLRVNRAIALGVDYLEGQQRSDGSFAGHEGQHPGGTTALVAFTLARSGVRKNDPMLERARAALTSVEFKSVYSASAHLLWCDASRDPANMVKAQRSLDFLLEHQEQGVWAYPWGSIDNSNTQFALLALRSARRMDLEVPEGVWLEAADGLRLFRHPSGGFLYTPEQRDPYAGITAAGLASLAVLQDVAADSARLSATLKRQSDEREQAERWLERNFDPARNFHDDGSWSTFEHFAYLWAVERWCGLTGRERIGGRDWYTEGATWLIESQARDGSFGAPRSLEDTCFALLFLRRATLSHDEELADIYDEIDRLRSDRPARYRRVGPEARRLTEWWLAGPWAQSGSEPILLEPPFDPAEVKPDARAKVARRDWERVSLDSDGWTDLGALSGRQGKRQLWLLSTWLRVAAGDGKTLDALLWLELKDGWDVWLDGRRVSRERRRSIAVSADVSWPLRLGPGEHLLTVLVENRQGAACFGALLTSPDNGKPPSGLVEHNGGPAERK